jgi:hypothetical protein
MNQTVHQLVQLILQGFGGSCLGSGPISGGAFFRQIAPKPCGQRGADSRKQNLS